MNKEAIERDGLKTVNDLLHKLNGWPVLEGITWNESGFEWKDVMYKFRKLGLSYDQLFDVYVGVNVLNTSRLIIKIDQSYLGLNREYLVKGLDNKIVQAYYDYLVDLAVIFGADKLTAEKEIRDALEFEINLAKMGLLKENRRNITALTNPMTIEEMQERFPSIPWQKYLGNLANDPNLELTPSTVTNVAVPDYLVKLEKLLKATPKRVQANYLLYRILIDLVTYLTQELRDRELQYSKVVDGISEHKPRWRKCVKIASQRLQFASGGLYVRRYFSENAKKAAEELVASLKKTFIEMLKRVDWMDEKTRREAIEKAEVMNAHVAYAQELLDDTKLTKYYSKLNSTADTFMEFAMAVRNFLDDVDFEELPRPYNRSDWSHRSFIGSVDAYYNILENSLELPAGILQSPFFSIDRPNYMNYGSIGYVIGHEITHGFDDEGSQHDKRGSARNWWAEDTKRSFNQKAQCIIDQYGNYTAPEVNKHLNGVATLGENIADNGGVKESYLAYEEWVKVNGEESRLPNLKYSPKQLFWISIANFWCKKIKTEALEQIIVTNVHAPPNFRILGSLSNSELFSTDFGCPVGSKMNPVHKCQVW
ncbi:hypothetical protein ILUMI_05875 [Ignelater luminosus]|uniref:Uncharacterized protein n=1 Tax=Ignelater luminosus TaxID=2038154 RepID=A0A8K0DGT7_IGNLU|nr:hypothetical protein ILUMI_05875 [Ignelater luminosus]